MLDLVYTNVYGSFRSTTRDEKHYYIIFTNSFSRCGCAYMIKHNFNTVSSPKVPEKLGNPLGRKIKWFPIQKEKGMPWYRVLRLS